MAKYLTFSGLQTFWNGLKTKLNNKVDKQDGYGLSKNDLTDELKSNYDEAYTFATTSGAEKNTIVGIKVNGTVSEITDERTVDITVPTTVAALDDADSYATVELLNTAKQTIQSSIDEVDGKFSNYYESSDIDSKINSLNEAIAAAEAGKIVKKSVESIDTTNNTVTIDGETSAAEENTIYFVPKDPTQPNNIKDEYMMLGESLEKIGDTEIDLADYAKTNDVNSSIETAKTEATGYADSLNTAMDARVQALEETTSEIEPITNEEIEEMMNS